MNYTLHYNRLIQSAQNRVIGGFTESHHIVPKCMGGSDEVSNLVDLTPEEHFVAHQLLAKMYPDNSSLRYAANMLGNINNKKYGWIRRAVSCNMKVANPMANKDARKRMGESQRKKWADPEYRKRQVESHKGNIPSNAKYHLAPPGQSWCGKHQEYLPVSSFYVDKARKDGLMVMCKECYKKLKLSRKNKNG